MSLYGDSRNCLEARRTQRQNAHRFRFSSVISVFQKNSSLKWSLVFLFLLAPSKESMRERSIQSKKSKLNLQLPIRTNTVPL